MYSASPSFSVNSVASNQFLFSFFMLMHFTYQLLYAGACKCSVTISLANCNSQTNIPVFLYTLCLFFNAMFVLFHFKNIFLMLIVFYFLISLEMFTSAADKDEEQFRQNLYFILACYSSMVFLMLMFKYHKL